MTAFVLGFRKQFAPAILRGEKRQTIRPNRKDGRRPRPGDRLKLFIGMRTPQCRALGIAEVTDCFPVYMDLESGNQVIVARDKPLVLRDLEDFAKADGFDSAPEMLNWFRQTYAPDASFQGWCVRWKNLKSGPRRVVK